MWQVALASIHRNPDAFDLLIVSDGSDDVSSSLLCHLLRTRAVIKPAKNNYGVGALARVLNKRSMQATHSALVGAGVAFIVGQGGGTTAVWNM